MSKVAETLNDALIRSTPPVGVSILGVSMPIADWVYVVTFIYVVMQIIVIAPKVIKTIRKAGNHEK